MMNMYYAGMGHQRAYKESLSTSSYPSMFAVDVRRSLDNCLICGTAIKTMIYKGTGLCSINCQKVQNGEALVPQVATVTHVG